LITDHPPHERGGATEVYAINQNGPAEMIDRHVLGDFPSTNVPSEEHNPTRLALGLFYRVFNFSLKRNRYNPELHDMDYPRWAKHCGGVDAGHKQTRIS